MTTPMSMAGVALPKFRTPAYPLGPTKASGSAWCELTRVSLMWVDLTSGANCTWYQYHNFPSIRSVERRYDKEIILPANWQLI